MIGILSCIWQRLERLPYLLQGVAGQDDQDFTLFLINNNYDIRQNVEEAVEPYANVIDVEIIHNRENLGPFARILVAHELSDYYDAFMTLDDDMEFPKNLVGQWKPYVGEADLQGYNGFTFNPQSSYWDRTQVTPGAVCHYVWGQNMLISSNVFELPTVTGLDRRYWLACDDLWLAYYVSHAYKGSIKTARIEGIGPIIDGKDTYMSNASLKNELLQALRSSGWNV